LFHFPPLALDLDPNSRSEPQLTHGREETKTELHLVFFKEIIRQDEEHKNIFEIDFFFSFQEFFKIQV